MPRSRSISTDISTDKKVKKASDFAALLYSWLIPHADDFGNFTNDPEEIQMKVIPERGKALEEILSALNELWTLRLIELSDKQLHFPLDVFYKYQNYIPSQKREKAENLRKSLIFKAAAISPQFVQNGASPSPSPSPSPSLVSSHKNSKKHTPFQGADGTENGKLTPEWLAETYNKEAADELPAVTKLSPQRRAKALKYLKAFPEESFWHEVFKETRLSSLLRGLRPSEGHENFNGKFDWLLTKGKDGTENCLKTFEGHYRDKS